MDTPFIYGRIATGENFTDREQETRLLLQNFSGLINTIIISPRRWGKTSLVKKALQVLHEKESGYITCSVDIFNCRTEEQFYTAYANAVLKASTSAWDEFVNGVKKYLGRMAPQISLSDGSQAYSLSFGIDFKDERFSMDEVLELPQKIAEDTGKRVIVCIDEFQNINSYTNPLAFQQKLRSHWQQHTSVSYCLYGSKRHMLLDIFSNYNSPFYKFGDILFLQKIKREDWVRFISEKFAQTGKRINKTLCGEIADKMKNHPYYTQQYSQQVWLRTRTVCDADILEKAFEGLIDQLSLLFANIIDTLTARQINFLLAVANGESGLSSKEILKRYDLGTSANIRNLKKATLEKDLIDILPNERIELQDPVFEYWLKHIYTGKH